MFHVEAVRQQEHAEKETVNNSERARASECCMTAPLANPDTHKLQPHEAVTHTHETMSPKSIQNECTRFRFCPHGFSVLSVHARGRPTCFRRLLHVPRASALVP